jgi:hypothetical protein
MRTAGLPTDVIKAWTLNQVVSAFYKSAGDPEQGGVEKGFSRMPLSKEESSNIRRNVLSGYGWISPAYGSIQGNLEDKIRWVVEKRVNNAYKLASRNIPVLHRNDIRKKTNNYRIYRATLDQLTYSAAPLKDINEMLKDQVRQYQDAMLEFICEHGPVVAEHVLEGRVSNPKDAYVGVQATINGLIGDVRRIKNKAKEDELRAFNSTEDLPNNNFLFDVNRWKEEYRDWLRACALDFICGNVEISIMEYYIFPANTFNNQIRDFVKVLDALMEIYETAGEPFESKEQLDEYCISNHPTLLNLITDAASLNWVRQSAMDAANNNMKIDFRKAVTRSFKNNPSSWTDETIVGKAVNARYLFDECLENLNFLSVLDKKLQLSEFCLAICSIKSGSIASEMLSYFDQLTSTLLAATSVSYASNGNSYGGKQKYILYPEGIAAGAGGFVTLSQIDQQMRDAAQRIDTNIQVLPSANSDQIVSYVIAYAMPLFALQGIEDWEKSYLLMSNATVVNLRKF